MSAARRYLVTVHAPVPEEDDGALERLRGVLEARGLEINELRTEEGPQGQQLFHLESTFEALSAYDAEQIHGREMFVGVLKEAAVADSSGQPQMSIKAERGDAG